MSIPCWSVTCMMSGVLPRAKPDTVIELPDVQIVSDTKIVTDTKAVGTKNVSKTRRFFQRLFS